MQGTGARAGLDPLFALDFSQRRPAPDFQKRGKAAPLVSIIPYLAPAVGAPAGTRTPK